jgi:WD40 repeat protein
MVDVFISYSRRDKEFVRTLHEALKNSQRDTWVDWQDIPLTADWWQEIERGIEGSDTFLFVISPDSVASKVRTQEIDHAIANHKRLFPIVRRDVDEALVHPNLKRHNWLLFRETDDFDDVFRKLTEAIDTDLDYVHAHTRLTVRAHEWDHKDRKDSFLLRGDDLEDAERWLAGSTDKAQQPTELQREYILNSRKVEDANQRANQILQEAAEKGRRRTRMGAIAAVTGLSVAGLSGLFALKMINEARIAQIGTRLERAGVASLEQFNYQPIRALISAIRNGKELRTLVRDNDITQLSDYPAVSPLYALQSILNQIHETNVIQGHEKIVRSASFSADGQRIVTASGDSTARVWNLQGRELVKLQGHKENVSSASFSADGQRIVTASDDRTARVWDLQGRELVKLQGHKERVSSASFSADGQRIVTASDDRTARVWDLQGRELVKLQGHEGGVWSASFSADGQRIVTASDDRTARVWDLQGRELVKLQGHEGEVMSASFSADGQRIVTASDDRTARVWDLQGRELLKLQGHEKIVRSASFSADGQRIVTADGTARVWAVENLDQLLTRACDWVRDYLTYNPGVSKSDAALCGIRRRSTSSN